MKKNFQKKYKYRNAYSIINSFNEIKKFYNICNKQKKNKSTKNHKYNLLWFGNNYVSQNEFTLKYILEKLYPIIFKKLN